MFRMFLTSSSCNTLSPYGCSARLYNSDYHSTSGGWNAGQSTLRNTYTSGWSLVKIRNPYRHPLEARHRIPFRQRNTKQYRTQKESSMNVNSFVVLMRKHTDIQKSNAEVIREFVERVEVFQPARIGGRKVQRLRIVWNCIGEFTPPQP